MHLVATSKKVSDITVADLKEIIRDTIFELIDPDYGLELNSEIEKALRKSRQSKERIPAEKVAKELGLKW